MTSLQSLKSEDSGMPVAPGFGPLCELGQAVTSGIVCHAALPPARPGNRCWSDRKKNPAEPGKKTVSLAVYFVIFGRCTSS